MGKQRLAPAVNALLIPALCAYYGFQLCSSGVLGRILAAVCLVGLAVVAVRQDRDRAGGQRRGD